MRVLALAGAGALALTMPITIGIVVVLAIVVISYRQTIVWHKVNGTPFASSVAPNHAEYLLFGRCGSVRLLDRLDTSVFAFRHNAKVHSRKLEGFLDRIEQVSPGPYLEMFARRARFGWDYWGDQSLGTAEMTA